MNEKLPLPDSLPFPGTEADFHQCHALGQRLVQSLMPDLSGSAPPFMTVTRSNVRVGEVSLHHGHPSFRFSCDICVKTSVGKPFADDSEALQWTRAEILRGIIEELPVAERLELLRLATQEALG